MKADVIKPVSPVRAFLRTHFELGDARMLAMEGLRALAVVLVFAHHFATQVLSLAAPAGLSLAAATAIRNYGNLGVELFFVLSGYLIYGALIRRPSFWKFMWRRVQRIHPAFLAVLLICVVGGLLTHSAKIPHDLGKAAVYLGANILLLPGLFPIKPVFTVAWTLSYEMFFYLSVSALVVTARLDRRSRDVRIATILGLAALLLTLVALHVPYVPVRMLPFFAGMLLFELDGLKTTPALAVAGLAAPLLAFLATAVLHLPLFRNVIAAELLHSAAFFALCFSCFRMGNVASAVFSLPPLRWLGNMSYSYYLTHGFIVAGVMQLLAKQLPAGAIWLTALPVFAGTLLLAAALYLAIEKPYSLDVKKRAAGRRSGAGLSKTAAT
jgi:peptidoglycan/LPS O-acetylase OafA/YrhL